jgi:hypothetical protein
VIDTIDSSQAYIIEIGKFYEDDQKLDTAYKLARKKAFLDISNLHAGFQRMTQEPTSRQSKTNELYEIVVNCHTLQAAAASLGIYIQIHHTTQASVDFRNSISAISAKLNNCKAIILEEQELKEGNDNLFNDAKLNLNAHYEDLTRQRRLQREAGTFASHPEFREKLKEARVVIDQLEWMYSVSNNLFSALKAYKST